jgi:hypothetical protein
VVELLKPNRNILLALGFEKVLLKEKLLDEGQKTEMLPLGSAGKTKMRFVRVNFVGGIDEY